MALKKRSKAPVGTNNASALQAKAEGLRRRAEALEAEAIRLQSPLECKQAAKRIAKGDGRVAVFLGAGASKAFGWPLTNKLLPLILDGLIERNLFEDVRINTEEENASDRELLTKTLVALCPGIEVTRAFLEKNEPRLPLVTSLLSMLDYSLSSGQALVSGVTADEIKNARVLLERAIYETIEHEDEATSPNNYPPREPNKWTTRLTEWLDSIRSSSTAVGVITSNYDVAIEKVWRFNQDDSKKVASLSLDFGFDWTWPSNSDPEIIIRRPATPHRRLYKLHGSTNWLRCGLCDRTYINPAVGIAIYAYKRQVKKSNSCHCGHAKLEVQIVSPSFVREVRAPNLISVWQQALNWLRKADDWIVIGYSFPDEDLNIRSLFTRALASRKTLPYVTAIQLGKNDQIRMRYEAFFPPGQITFLTGGLEVFLANA